jgi:hypothetical protein
MAEYDHLFSSAMVGVTVVSLGTASIAQHCTALRLATGGAQFASLAEEASQQNHSHLCCLEALLQAESEDRERPQRAAQIGAAREGKQ